MTNPLDLHALADQELDRREANRVREEMRNDPLAAAEYSAVLNLKDVLRGRAVRQECETEWRACVRRLDELDRDRRIEGFVGRYAWAIAAAFFLLIVGGRGMMQGVQGPSVQTPEISRIASGLVPKRMPAAQSAAERDRWLDEVLGQAKKEVATDRLTVLGGATGTWAGMRIAQLDLTDGKGDLRLIIVPGLLNLQDAARIPGDPPVYAGMVGRVNSVAWTANGNSMILLGTRPYVELQGIARQIAGK